MEGSPNSPHPLQGSNLGAGADEWPRSFVLRGRGRGRLYIFPWLIRISLVVFILLFVYAIYSASFMIRYAQDQELIQARLEKIAKRDRYLQHYAGALMNYTLRLASMAESIDGSSATMSQNVAALVRALENIPLGPRHHYPSLESFDSTDCDDEEALSDGNVEFDPWRGFEDGEGPPSEERPKVEQLLSRENHVH